MKITEPVLRHRRRHAQTWLAMRLTALLLTLGFLQVSASGLSQKITFQGAQVKLEKVFAAIEKQTPYVFVYRNQDLAKANPVSLSLKEVTIEQALEISFKDQPFTYKVIDKTIVVSPKPAPGSKAVDFQPTATLPLPPPPTVHGRITNEKGEAVAGVSISIKGGKTIGVTNDNGEFTLTNVADNAILVFSAINTETLEIKLNGRSEINLGLKSKVSVLDEVQMIAYGTTNRRIGTGDISTVKADDIAKQPVSNPLLALQGRIPGMEIIQSTGLPGSGVTVKIRGQNSIQNGNDPLYIIDGVPYFSQNVVTGLDRILGLSGTNASGSPLSNINPSDIESIDVLKDADATAIYGSRGANGVVLITTKKGKAGQMKVDVNMETGWGKVAKELGLLNTRQYLDMRYEALKNDGITTIPATNFDLTLWDTTRNTDWQKELIGGTSHYSDVQASISGGNDNIQYLIGGGYHKETTVFPGDMADQKASLHFNINSVSANQKFRVLLSGNYLVDNNRLMKNDLTALATTLSPDAPALYNADGSLNWAPRPTGLGTWTNPLTLLMLKFRNSISNLVSNVVLSYRLLPGLEIKSSLGYSNTQTEQYNLTPLTSFDPFNWTAFGNSARTARFANNNIRSWIIEPHVTYTKNIDKGKLSILFGTTIQQSSGSGLGVNASGFSSDLVLEDVLSAPTVSVYSNINSLYKYNAIFGRLNYNWQDKYLLNLTARRDGTSRFGPDKQFANFYAIGSGWVFSKENFMQKSLPFLSYGKLRASYGTTGSDQVGDYSFLDLYSPISVGVPYQGVVGIGPTQLFAPDLAWEETRKLEIGLELGLLNDRILFTTSYYHNRSSNQLTNNTLPYVTGFSSISKNLDATIQNTGWEFLLNTTNVDSKNFHWTSSVNLTMNRNKMISVDSGMSANYKKLVGYPLGTQFVFHFLGVDQTSGVYQFANNLGNPTITPNFSTDAVAMNIRPKYYGGFQNTFEYKRFQLDFLFQFVKQLGFTYLYNIIPGQGISRGNQSTAVLSHWQKQGDISNIQRFSQNTSLNSAFGNAKNSDQTLSDASYIRLKNLSVSWKLPDLWRQKAHLQTARIFIQGQNLLTITKYKGMDPETQSAISLPPLRVWIMGIQITL